jgi:hypothetical protein
MGHSEMLLVRCWARLWKFGGHVKNPLGTTKNPNKWNTTHLPKRTQIRPLQRMLRYVFN